MYTLLYFIFIYNTHLIANLINSNNKYSSIVINVEGTHISTTPLINDQSYSHENILSTKSIYSQHSMNSAKNFLSPFRCCLQNCYGFNHCRRCCIETWNKSRKNAETNARN